MESESSRYLLLEISPLGHPVNQGPYYQRTNPPLQDGLVCTNILSILSSNQHTARAPVRANLEGRTQQESGHDTSRPSTFRGRSSGKRRQKNCQTSINVDSTASRLEAPSDNPQNQMHSNRNPRSDYNSRPASLKRLYGDERLVTGKDKNSMQSRKRLKLKGLENDLKFCGKVFVV
ncbi:hypothetical protein NOR_08686 [Metarhizium rileyi]|uniref:Uncharacterized protein n=1 Tax=Metarhizium rileyi (strain RCEF 4871) TaxID=1649241 RepID=A0A166VUX3_METRR|nr:hypothetical protein NOR_08686 [Metarhizium rileyi RCEF 4871]